MLYTNIHIKYYIKKYQTSRYIIYNTKTSGVVVEEDNQKQRTWGKTIQTISETTAHMITYKHNSNKSLTKK